MNPDQRMALLRDLLVASEIERDAIIKAKQTHIDTLRQRIDQLLSFTQPKAAEVADSNEVKS
jgi:uncharacterized protein involved in tolerance to divalent cations